MNNNIYIYAVSITNKPDHYQFNQLLSKIKEEKAKKILKYHFQDDSLRSLYGELILIYGLKYIYNINYQDIDISQNSYGKPYLVSDIPIYYNLSHSGEWAVCAFHNKNIGIDVEQIQDIDFNIANRFFASSESESLLLKTGIQKKKHFFDLWTLKESYIKYKGKGLSIPLDSFSFDIHQTISLNSTEESAPLFFKQYELNDQYKVSVCSESSIFPDSLKYLDISDLS